MKELIDQKIGDLEDANRQLKADNMRLGAENHLLQARLTELTMACRGIPRFDHAVKLSDHLESGSGVMLRDPKREEWLRRNPWPT